MTPAEVAAAFQAAGRPVPEQVGEQVGGALGFRPEESAPGQEVAGVMGEDFGEVGGVLGAPSALPNAGDALPLAAQALLGFSSLLGGAGILLRRMRR